MPNTEFKKTVKKKIITYSVFALLERDVKQGKHGKRQEKKY